jgi:hypothetical protein
MITQERLHELFDYREDGNLIRKVSTCNSVKIGDVAGSRSSIGYQQIYIVNKRYLLHRLIFLYHHGYLTSGMQIDHIDRNPSNNRIENLREVSQTQNMQNTKIHSMNTSGVKGVSWNTKNRKWVAQIHVTGKKAYLGMYSTLEEAAAVVKEAREKYHGEYARHE